MPAHGTETREQLQALHTPAAVRKRLEGEDRQSYLSDFIYGAIDGAVTTFAVVAGVAGADLSASIVIILGAANLFADGFSMAVANFLGTRAENQQRERARRSEEREIELHPEGEREEIKQIFARKGFSGQVLSDIVDVITSDKQRWLDTMMTEEHGLSRMPRVAARAAAATFIAFIIVGAIPLMPYFILIGSDALTQRAFLWSIVMTSAAFFAVGAMKSRFVDQRWWTSGLETLGVGGVAAVIAYLIGMALKGVANGV